MAREEPKVNLRLPQELKDKISARAAENKRSINAEIVAAIELALSMPSTASNNLLLEKIISGELASGSLKLDQVLDRLDELDRRISNIPVSK